MKTLIYISLAVVIILLISTVVMAQNPPALPFMNDADQAPIDGGLSLLALAGGGYAIKKLRGRKNDEVL